SMIVFFIVHYGGFTLGHGVFVIAMFGLDIGSPLQILLAWSLLFLSHFRSYRRHFIRNGEYRRTSFDRLFFQPYKRIIIMHITILAGGALAKSMNAPPLALAVMVLLKTGIDLVSHVFEHRKFSKRPVSGQGLPPDCYQPEKRL
ncbi:hypothetical protein JW964_22685, partial [candidate division KSB1 bacterium]|nr:hypothetical protein [candidate division KSB1 bacterium]